MDILFERQQYQDDCVSNIMEVLEGSDRLKNFNKIHENIRKIHEKKIIPERLRNRKPIKRLDILMETGTGKTFTYLKTMYEMNKRYGINKFIVFVPRMAIKEGVLQNIRLTSNYFYQDYSKRLEAHSYGGKNGTSQIGSYLRDKERFSVLVLTSHSIAAKNKQDRILARPHEDLFGGSPLSALGKMKPVIFIDEPHLLKGDEFMRAYRDYFTESLCLRFGATFPQEETHKIANLVYVLDSLQAFRSYLVKKIQVTNVGETKEGIHFKKSPQQKKLEYRIIRKTNPIRILFLLVKI